MATMLNVYDRETREKTAVLQNAFDIVETQRLNNIYYLSFSLPATDDKAQYCQPRYYVRWGDDGELYRIKSPKISESNTSVITYECEHVITTLCDSVMFGSYQYGGAGVRTSEVINWLLSQQKDPHWILSECDFDRKFEYLWEQENILNALYSVPKEFASLYKWTFDTTVYPWRLSLKAINTESDQEYYLRAKSNILASGTSADYANICTRVYPLGYGEGVNQLTIKDVNDGVPYLQSPDSIVAQYGIVEKVLVDRRFENADSLKAYAQSMLEVYQTPSMSRSFNVIDLYPLTNDNIDDAEVGKICKLTEDDTIAYITKTSWQRDKAGDLQIELSTKTTDIASSIADLADRVRIESVYAQGATQLYQHSKDANATPDNGMTLSLYFPEEMRQINKVLLKMSLKKFRSYSNTTSDAGATRKTTSDGGSSNRTTSNGGASTQTSTSGGASTQTSSSGGGTGTTSTGASSISASVTSGASSIITTESGGLGSDIETSGTVVQGKTANIPLETQEGGGVTNKEVTKTLDVDLSTSENGGVTDKETTSVDKYNKETTSGGGGDSDYTGYSTFNIKSVSTNYGSEYTSGAKASIWCDNAGSHNHNIWGYTGYVTPPASQNYYHQHGINYTGGALENGSHSHYLSQNDHSHYIYHNHGLNLSNVGNHRHTVTVPAHTHKVTIDKHSHKITLSNHKHTVKISGHTHTVSIPAHTHKINDHLHYLDCNSHSHSISKALFAHTHGMDHTHTINLSGVGSHSHTFSISAHTHTVSIPAHTHNVTIPAHTHTVSIPNHTHTIDIPAHSHDIVAGIFESGNPTAFDIYVNRTKKTTIYDTSYNDDITEWLLNDKNQIPRNTWLDVEIRPNDLAYVVSSVFVQGFVQSRGGGNY